MYYSPSTQVHVHSARTYTLHTRVHTHRRHTLRVRSLRAHCQLAMCSAGATAPLLEAAWLEFCRAGGLGGRSGRLHEHARHRG